VSEGTDALTVLLESARAEASDWRCRYEQERRDRVTDVAAVTQQVEQLTTEIRRYEIKIEAHAEALGGTVVFDPMDTPYGRMAGLADPTGAHFSIGGNAR